MENSKSWKTLEQQKMGHQSQRKLTCKSYKRLKLSRETHLTCKVSHSLSRVISEKKNSCKMNFLMNHIYTISHYIIISDYIVEIYIKKTLIDN